LLMKPLKGSARLIKDGKQQTSWVILLDLLFGKLFGCCYLSFFKEENDWEGESKEVVWRVSALCLIE
jgi:hypothetical protein